MEPSRLLIGVAISATMGWRGNAGIAGASGWMRNLGRYSPRRRSEGGVKRVPPHAIRPRLFLAQPGGRWSPVPSSLGTVEPTDEGLVALLEEIRGERPARTVRVFDHALARRIGSAASDVAERDGLPVAICMTRAVQRVARVAFEGTKAEHDAWVQRRVDTVPRHEVPSVELVVRRQAAQRASEWLDPTKLAVAGAIPMEAVGVIVDFGLVPCICAGGDLAMAAFVASTTDL